MVPIWYHCLLFLQFRLPASSILCYSPSPASFCSFSSHLRFIIFFSFVFSPIHSYSSSSSSLPTSCIPLPLLKEPYHHPLPHCSPPPHPLSTELISSSSIPDSSACYCHRCLYFYCYSIHSRSRCRHRCMPSQAHR